MLSSLSALLVCAYLASATPVIEQSRHQRELKEHYDHLSYIAEYSCHHPQPRSVSVHELLSPYQTRGKAYFPEMTVLHRCDVFAGCCEGGKKCGPLHADSVHLPFKVTFLEDMGDKHKGEWVMEYYSLDNHTVCGCHHQNGLKPLHPQEKDYDRDSRDHHSHDHHHDTPEGQGIDIRKDYPYRPAIGHDDHHISTHKDGYKPVHDYDHHISTHKDGYKPVHDDHEHHVTTTNRGYKPVYEEPEQLDEPAEPRMRRDNEPDQKYANGKLNPFYLTI